MRYYIVISGLSLSKAFFIRADSIHRAVSEAAKRYEKEKENEDPDHWFPSLYTIIVLEESNYEDDIQGQVEHSPN